MLMIRDWRCLFLYQNPRIKMHFSLLAIAAVMCYYILFLCNRNFVVLAIGNLEMHIPSEKETENETS